MKEDFHYYIVYLISIQAGFSPIESEIIAYASQYTDDNTKQFVINYQQYEEYKNYISQTFNILKPRKDLRRIYPVFHFLPGDPAKANIRWDGLKHDMVTTPESENAKTMMEEAFKSKNLYRIGIACHVYADTFSHQDFVGLNTIYNKMPGMINTLIPNIGHADAKQKPDLANCFEDKRLFLKNCGINKYLRNTFIDASFSLFKEMTNLKKKYFGNDENNVGDVNFLIKELTNVIQKDEDLKIRTKESRINRCRELSTHKEFGNVMIPYYNPYKWFNDAVKVENFIKNYKWRDLKNYTKTHWYQFQEAVKNHQNFIINMLLNRNMRYINLENF